MHARVDLRGPRFKKINQKKKTNGTFFFCCYSSITKLFRLFLSLLFNFV